MTPYLDDGDIQLYHGDVIDVLRSLPAGVAQTCITSPPYWGLRDYGTGAWTGGDADCDHGAERIACRQSERQSDLDGGTPGSLRDKPTTTCRCGARREDSQLGLEATPDQYVERMVAVFREVWRVLRADGTVWLNLGDSYAGTSVGYAPDAPSNLAGSKQSTNCGSTGQVARMPPGLKSKDLCGIPWRVAFALQQPWYSGRITNIHDRIWLAAMIDAEGCMFIHKRKVGQSNGQGYVRKNDSYGAGLEVSSTDRVIVERCLEITGLGSICEQSPEQNERRKQTIYRWNLRSNVCRDVIRELYPHLVAKQREARLLLGCPSSGPDAERAHKSLKALHQGGTPDIDFAAPASMFEAGWCLRSDVIWAKCIPNPMPESVTDRPTKAHEYLFLLSKQPRYFYDADAIREEFEARPQQRLTATKDQPLGGARIAAGVQQGDVQGGTHRSRFAVQDAQLICGCIDAGCGRSFSENDCGCACHSLTPCFCTHYCGQAPGGGRCIGLPGTSRVTAGRNRRSVWEIATQPFPEAHFATFPEALVRPCILAGTSERGECSACGAPWQREVERGEFKPSNGRSGAVHSPEYGQRMHGLADRSGVGEVAQGFGRYETETTGWRASCTCDAPTRPQTCLDPFIGSGTTALVARKHGRRCIGIDLSAEYLGIAARRLQQLSLFADPA